ncbi:MAG: hypothetical protein GY828_08435 [Candidatus Gracilibacteria bacterium]|nr:hypothetical protein [Candidatus Gracilibacteria bacterium]
MSYNENTNEDLKNFLDKRGVTSCDNIKDLNEDQLEIAGAMITSYIGSILSNKIWKEVIGSSQELVTEMNESFEGNDLLDIKSHNLLYLDLHVKAESVIQEIKNRSDEVISILSIFELRNEDAELLLEKKITYHEIIKK